MTDLPSGQFRQPALKVGGRRLSTTSKVKPHVAAAETKTPSPPASDNERQDYPRPAPPGEQPPAHEHPHDDHEEVPKREKKKGHVAAEHEKQDLYHKAEQNRPSKDLGMNARHNVGGGGRITQPAGKAFIA
ncbi:hypothetical protein C8Q75DRAFT_807127 [Abortiporus biennis]|nr:hypothetical protein C8Q75DRAFT_807127 [Abortiporus biennis]